MPLEQPRNVTDKPRPDYRTADGKRVPSVTTILDRVMAKPALITWANRIGLQGKDLDSERDRTADAGSIAHELIAAHLEGRAPDLVYYDPGAYEAGQFGYLNAREWLSANTVEPLLIETPLVSEQYRYGGTVDLYARVNGRLEVIDWKTSSGIYPDNFYQLAGYRAMLIENGHPVNGVRVVSIGRELSDRFPQTKVESEPETLDRAWFTFWYARQLYTLTQTKQAI